eukprot:992641-Amphidinium_carterae.3
MGWARLLKLWGCMRKDDLLAADPQSMRHTTAGLSLTLRQTKTTEPGRRHRLVQCHIASDLNLTGWATDRDCFVPKPDSSLMSVSSKMASTEEVTAYGRLILQELRVPGGERRGTDG